MVLCPAVNYIIRANALVSKPCLVYETYAALPVALEKVSRCGALNVVLATHKVPHKVPPVHIVELIVEEIGKICPESGLLELRAYYASSLALGVHIIEAYVGVAGPSRIHSREEHLCSRIILRLHRSLQLLIFSVNKVVICRGL